MGKTVYFLGAGFSKDAGGCIQNEIIKNLLSDDFANSHKGDQLIIKSLNQFKNFLWKGLNIYKSKFEAVELEDIFTPIDRCIADGQSFGKYSSQALSTLRENFEILLAMSIQFGIEDCKECNQEYIKQFAEYINSIASRRIEDIKNDNIAVITTNWDILLDTHLNNAIDNSEDGPLNVVDYCCHVSSLDENGSDDNCIKPGLYALGTGGYNIKYLKLHGSMNWLHCPMCQRMYIYFQAETKILKECYCKHCFKNFKFKKNSKLSSIKLKGNLLLPTFLKDLSNLQIKLVWQNAAVELSEAEKVVFIGYSLPAADFEIRQLLSRFVRKDAEIKVVLYPGSGSDDKRIEEEKKRYKNFFGKRISKKSFIVEKVPEYIHNLRN